MVNNSTSPEQKKKNFVKEQHCIQVLWECVSIDNKNKYQNFS